MPMRSEFAKHSCGANLASALSTPPARLSNQFHGIAGGVRFCYHDKLSWAKPLHAPSNSASLIIRRSKLNFDLISWQNPNPANSHFARDIRKNLAFIFKFYLKSRARQRLQYNAFNSHLVRVDIII